MIDGISKKKMFNGIEKINLKLESVFVVLLVQSELSRRLFIYFF